MSQSKFIQMRHMIGNCRKAYEEYTVVRIMIEFNSLMITKLLTHVDQKYGIVPTDVLERFRPSRRVLDTKTDVLSDMESHIENEDPQTVYFLEYSSQRAQRAIQFALEKGWDVYLLIRHPNRDLKWRVSENQSTNIIRELDEMCQHYSDYAYDDVELKIQFYYQQAGLRARRIGDKWLYVSWYTFDNRNGDEPADKHVQGDNNPTFKLRRGMDGFESINRFFEMSYHALWQEGDSLQTVLEDNALRHDVDNWLDGGKSNARERFVKYTDENAKSVFQGSKSEAKEIEDWQLFKRNDAVPCQIGEEIKIKKDTPVQWTANDNEATVRRQPDDK